MFKLSQEESKGLIWSCVSILQLSAHHASCAPHMTYFLSCVDKYAITLTLK